MSAANTTRWHRFSRSGLCSVVLYAVLIASMHWPLVCNATTSVVIGPTNSSVVPLFNTWTFWWNADRVLHGFQGYWDAPIFYPVADTFAFSEPQPTALIVAPVIWLTGSRILAYNVYFWLAWLLNGVFAERLLRLRGSPRALARLGGMAVILLPMLQWNRDVIQLIPVWGVLWTWTCGLKLSQAVSWQRGVELGVAVSLTSLMCMHYGLFTVLLIMAAGWPLVRGWTRWQTWCSWGTAGLVATVLAGPMLWYVHQVLARQHFVRPEALVRDLSMRPGDFTAAWGVSLIPWGTMSARPPDWLMSPGWIKCGVAVLGVFVGLTCRRSRRWTLFLMFTAGAAFGLALGKNLAIGNWSIWDQLCRFVPGLGQVRSPYRFANYFQLAVVLLSFEMLRWGMLVDKAHRIRNAMWVAVTIGDRLRSHAGRLGLLLVGLAVTFEILPPRVQLWNSSEIQGGSRWMEYVRKETPAGRAVLCLPFARGSDLQIFDLTAKWMYLGTFHGVPLVNGYSGFFPPEELELRGEFHSAAPTVERLVQLHQDGVEFIVAASELLDHPLPSSSSRLQIDKVLSDPSGVDVYRLSRPAVQ